MALFFHFLFSNFHLLLLGGIVREVIFTEKGPKAIGPYSHAIKANGFIFGSGSTAFDSITLNTLTGAAAAQTECIMENLKTIVQAAGSSLDRAVRLGVFLKDMNDFTAVNEVYARYFPKDPPARTTVEVARLPRDFRVEIDLIALA